MHLTGVLLAITAVSQSGKSYPQVPGTSLFKPIGLHGQESFKQKLYRKDALCALRPTSPYLDAGRDSRLHRTVLRSAVAVGLDRDKAVSDPTGRILVTKSFMTRSLAFLAGVADVLCSHRHECYANMMTGNTIKFATSVAEVRPIDAAFYAAVLTSYVVGFGAYRAADRLVARRREGAGESQAEEPQPSSTPIVAAPAILAMFSLYDILSGSSTTRWFVPVLTAGSAAVNAAGTEATGAVTCMMTGNIGKVANYATDSFLSVLLGGPRVKGERRRGARSSVGIVASFMSGIAVATVAIRMGGAMVQSVSYASGGVAAAAIISTVGRMPFTVLGGVYALLLVAFDRPMPIKSPRKLLRQISWGMHEDAAEPCQLDKYEAECLVEPESKKMAAKGQ